MSGAPINLTNYNERNPAMAVIVDKSAAGTTYTCVALPGSATSAPVWRVQRDVTNASVTTTTWAGTGGFDQVAANRASLTYA